jgi:hypothetical protein
VIWRFFASDGAESDSGRGFQTLFMPNTRSLQQ